MHVQVNVPNHLVPFVNFDDYNQLGAEGQRAYLQGMAAILAHQDEIVQGMNEALAVEGHIMDISFVGMRYRGNHHFQPTDKVILQSEHLNLYDRFAVKVLLEDGQGGRDHVAYVTSDDAKALRRIPGFQQAPLEFLGYSDPGNTVYYRVHF
ncbi:hypothetical protein BGZ83_000838 [Gryganskiella cystojenkinii]|nr:hypothetical protein BGZ83_000838 [Gryganskiella cystojenkinii]